MPTEHPCDDGSHDCDTMSTRCEELMGGYGYACSCLEGFVSADVSYEMASTRNDDGSITTENADGSSSTISADGMMTTYTDMDGIMRTNLGSGSGER